MKGDTVKSFINNLPHVLAVNDFIATVKAIVRARQYGRPVILGMGAHPIKVGLSPVIIDLMKKNIITAIATNGACIVHDFELSEIVLGERMRVFKNRLPSLRAMLQQSAQHGDKEYIVWQDRRISYAEHLQRVASVAHALQQRYGIGKGDRVAILAENRPEWVMTFWATVSLGAIAVAMNGWWTADEIAYGIEDSEPKLLIADRKRLARAGRVNVPVVEIESEFASLLAHAPGAALPDEPIEEDAPAVILYTSGTTGRPKGLSTALKLCEMLLSRIAHERTGANQNAGNFGEVFCRANP